MTIYFIYTEDLEQNQTVYNLAEAEQAFKRMSAETNKEVHLHSEEYASQEDFEAGNMITGDCLMVKG